MLDVGDIAHYPQKEGGELRRIEHWNVSVVFLYRRHTFVKFEHRLRVITAVPLPRLLSEN